MSLQKSLKEIKNYFINRYSNNLSSIILFGSVVTNNYIERKSDIDTIIILKKRYNLNLDEEKRKSFEERTEPKLSIQNLIDIKYAKENLIFGKSWSTYWALASERGSQVLYSTPEFKSLKKYFLKNPPKREIIKLHIKEKDKIDLEKLFPKWKGFLATKYLTFHIRRKLQVLNYFKTGNYIYDFGECLKNLKFNEREQNGLEKLIKSYKNRELLSKKEINSFVKLAYNLTKKIEKEI